MKTIKTIPFLKATLLLPLAIILTIGACKKSTDTPDSPADDPGAIRGAAGNPRFNLQFTNGSRTDLDLYVQTPNGSIISYSNTSAQNGKLDVDCLCGDCPNGPNENIFWTPGSAPRGTYKVWVEYFDDCDGAGTSSNFTLRVMNNSSIVQTYSGTLSPNNRKSQVYTYTF